jgi:hypothetical protein
VSHALYSTPSACCPCTYFLRHISCHLLLEPHRETIGQESPIPQAEEPPYFLTSQLSGLTVKRPLETSAPNSLSITNALHQWATHTVPGLSLERERDKFLWYARAHQLTNVDWIEALKGWCLEAHARAMSRRDIIPSALPRPEPQVEPPPLYNPELLAQMKADIARLCGPPEPSIARTSEHERPRRRHTLSILSVEGVALERDPAYLAQIQARKAVLQAQAAWLQTGESCDETAGAAD